MRHYDAAVALPCSGNGRCITLQYANALQDYRKYFTSITYEAWDANMIQACQCEEGWEGIACEQKSCPKGDDPDTPGVDEIQIIDCTCTTCGGGMYLTFRGEQTRAIPWDASNALIRDRLMELSTVDEVSVRVAYGTELCSTGGSATKVIFRMPTGDVPDMEIETYGTLAGTVEIKTGGKWSMVTGATHLESQTGTKEYAECSNRGNCDYDRGQCECIPGFASSDGQGHAGSINDCGFREKHGLSVTTTDATYDNYENGTVLYYNLDGTIENTVTNCPFVQNVGICSQHGTCDETTNTCSCHDGWTGPVCDRRSCGSTTMWFGELGSTSTHANTAECGGIGTCNRETGQCIDCGGPYGAFGGNSCEQLKCPTSDSGDACNAVGYCRSLRDITSLQWLENKEQASFTYVYCYILLSFLSCL
jgi:hypothetical protein